MPSRKIKRFCQHIEDNHYSLDYDLAISGAIDLGKLYHFLGEATAEDKKLLKATLGEVKQKLTDKVIQRIWHDINGEVQANHRRLEGYVEPINTLKKEMITDIFYLKELSRKSIIQFGQEYQWCRYSMIGLIRQQLEKDGVSDPFLDSDFSYEYLEQDGARGSASILTPFIKRCSVFPVDDIYALGKEDEDLAKLILIDLTGTLPFFQVSSRYADRYPSLRSDIARAWQAFFENNALSSRMRTFIPDELKRLKAQYDEFSRVKINARQTRHSEPRPANGEHQEANHAQAGRYLLVAAFATFFARKTICKVACVTAAKVAGIAATPMAAPVAVGLGGLGVGYAAYKWGPQAYRAARDWAQQPASRRSNGARRT